VRLETRLAARVRQLELTAQALPEEDRTERMRAALAAGRARLSLRPPLNGRVTGPGDPGHQALREGARP
jgi:hypothetical protein